MRAAAWRRGRGVAWWIATLILLGLTATALLQRTTWYLSVDQYGYLTFAEDLAHGRLFHQWPPLQALAPRLPPVVDVLFQAYVYDRGTVYCRYAPGFPLLLAGWIRLFGKDAAHLLNPLLFVLLLVLLLAFGTRLLGSRWRAAIALGLLLLARSSVLLWGTTLVRDPAAHLAGLLGVFALLPRGGRRLTPRRATGAGMALGYAVAIRPDALIYLIPGSLLAGLRWRREVRRAGRVAGAPAAALLGVVLGLSPLLAYNWAATGNPLRLTQGMEMERFLSLPSDPTPLAAPGASGRVGYPSGAFRGTSSVPVHGGGLSLANLPHTLPGNVLLLRLAYGDALLGLALLGIAVASVRRRLLLLATVPYALAALLLYSCWARPDPRYLFGIHLLVPLLVAEGVFGTLDVVRELALRGRPIQGRMLALVAAAAFLAAASVTPAAGVQTALPLLALIVPGVGAGAALVAAARPRRRIAPRAEILLAIALVGLAFSHGPGRLLHSRAEFQGPEVQRARETLARGVVRGAVVITSEELGRPAENIDHYSGVAHALYLTDLARWHLPVADAALALATHGMSPYLLVARDEPARPALLRELTGSVSVELVADVPPEDAIRYFVVGPRRRAVRLELYRLAQRGG